MGAISSKIMSLIESERRDFPKFHLSIAIE